jgi:hypothetical protein
MLLICDADLYAEACSDQYHHTNSKVISTFGKGNNMMCTVKETPPHQVFTEPKQSAAQPAYSDHCSRGRTMGQSTSYVGLMLFHILPHYFPHIGS